MSPITKGGTSVACGRHMVPEGIAVEVLFDTKPGDLKTLCPLEVKLLLERKNLQAEYDAMVSRFNDEGIDWSAWKEEKLAPIVQDMRSQFEDKGVKLALCVLRAGTGGEFRWLWLEFMDVATVPPTYTPEYDVSYQKVELDGSYLIPPKGVAVEILDDFQPDTLVKECPPNVKDLLEPRGLMSTYQDLVKALWESKSTRLWYGSWTTSGVLPVVGTFQEEFNRKGIDVRVNKCPQYGGLDVWKWLEFVDTSLLTDYCSKYDVDAKKRAQVQVWSSPSIMRSSSIHLEGVAVEQIMSNGVPVLSEECPPEVAELLESKGLMPMYDKVHNAVSKAKSIANFEGIWRTTGLEGALISFQPIDDLKSSFESKGVKVLLCESSGSSAKSLWFEFVDMEASPNYSPSHDVTFIGKEVNGKVYRGVVGGRHLVPEGVAVEELTEVSKMTDDCPKEVQKLLNAKGLMPTYDRFIEAFTSADSTRSWAETWRSNEIVSVLQDFQGEFQAKGVKAVLCKLKPSQGTFRWFEYIDMAIATDYVPQFDVASFEDEIEIAITEFIQKTLKFPKGVAVEELMDKKTVVKEMPPPVKSMMDKKACMDLYIEFIDIMISSGDDGVWSKESMQQVANVIVPNFEAKGVSIFLSVLEDHMWVEFVDRDEQPNYSAQYGIDAKKIPPGPMTKKELTDFAIFTVLPAIMFGVQFAASAFS